MPQVGSEFSWIMTSDTASQPEIKPETTEDKTEDKVDTEEWHELTLVDFRLAMVDLGWTEVVPILS